MIDEQMIQRYRDIRADAHDMWENMNLEFIHTSVADDQMAAEMALHEEDKRLFDADFNAGFLGVTGYERSKTTGYYEGRRMQGAFPAVDRADLVAAADGIQVAGQNPWLDEHEGFRSPEDARQILEAMSPERREAAAAGLEDLLEERREALRAQVGPLGWGTEEGLAARRQFADETTPLRELAKEYEPAPVMKEMQEEPEAKESVDPADDIDFTALEKKLEEELLAGRPNGQEAPQEDPAPPELPPAAADPDDDLDTDKLAEKLAAERVTGQKAVSAPEAAAEPWTDGQKKQVRQRVAEALKVTEKMDGTLTTFIQQLDERGIIAEMSFRGDGALNGIRFTDTPGRRGVKASDIGKAFARGQLIYDPLRDKEDRKWNPVSFDAERDAEAIEHARAAFAGETDREYRPVDYRSGAGLGSLGEDNYTSVAERPISIPRPYEAADDAKIRAVAAGLRQMAESFPAEKYEIGLMADMDKDLPKAERRPFIRRIVERAEFESGAFAKAIAGHSLERGICCRPVDDRVILVDDLSLEEARALPTRMILRSSPDNYQAWVVAPQEIEHDLVTPLCKAIAERWSGDPGAAKERQPGRVPGTQNHKPGRVAQNEGTPPEVRAVSVRPGAVIDEETMAQLMERAQEISYDLGVTAPRSSSGSGVEKLKDMSLEQLWANVEKREQNTLARIKREADRPGLAPEKREAALTKFESRQGRTAEYARHQFIGAAMAAGREPRQIRDALMEHGGVAEKVLATKMVVAAKNRIEKAQEFVQRKHDKLVDQRQDLGLAKDDGSVDQSRLDYTVAECAINCGHNYLDVGVALFRVSPKARDEGYGYAERTSDNARAHVAEKRISRIARICAQREKSRKVSP